MMDDWEWEDDYYESRKAERERADAYEQHLNEEYETIRENKHLD